VSSLRTQGKLACDRGVLIGVLGKSSELQVSNLFSDVSEHPSVEAWLSALEDGNANSRGVPSVLEAFLCAMDSRPTPGIHVTGKELERLCAP